MKKSFEFRQAPIFMASSFYPVVLFEADSGFRKRESDEPVRLEVAIEDLHFESMEGKDNEFAVYMNIKMMWPDEEIPPYKNALVQAGGFFSLSPDLPEGLVDKYRGLSGPSMLYSSAREFIKIITANGPWGPIMLPGMHFQETHSGKEAETVIVQEKDDQPQ